MKRSPYPPAAACLSGVTVFRSCEKLTARSGAISPASRSQRIHAAPVNGVARTTLGHPRDFRVPLQKRCLNLFTERSIGTANNVLKRPADQRTVELNCGFLYVQGELGSGKMHGTSISVTFGRQSKFSLRFCCFTCFHTNMSLHKQTQSGRKFYHSLLRNSCSCFNILNR